MTDKIARRLKIKASVRGKISGTAEKPRMSVFRSNSQIYVQLIDDTAANGSGKTLLAESSVSIKEKMTKTEKSAKVGELIAKKAIAEAVTPFKSIKEYLTEMDKIVFSGDSVFYNEDGSITIKTE